MHKTFSITILTTILILSGVATSLATWQISLEISTPDANSDTGLASNTLYTGSDPTATAGYDNQFDTIALLDGPIQAYFSHPEYPTGQQKMWRDYRPESLPQEWEVEVHSEVDRTVNINWEINTSDNMNFSLIDRDSGQEIDTASSTAYTYSSSSTIPKKFLLKVSEDASAISPPPASGGSGGGSKGGGCGYIRNIGQKSDSINKRGQITLNLIILILPLLLPFQHYIRRYTFGSARVKTVDT